MREAERRDIEERRLCRERNERNSDLSPVCSGNLFPWQTQRIIHKVMLHSLHLICTSQSHLLSSWKLRQSWKEDVYPVYNLAAGNEFPKPCVLLASLAGFPLLCTQVMSLGQCWVSCLLSCSERGSSTVWECGHFPLGWLLSVLGVLGSRCVDIVVGTQAWCPEAWIFRTTDRTMSLLHWQADLTTDTESHATLKFPECCFITTFFLISQDFCALWTHISPSLACVENNVSPATMDFPESSTGRCMD